jgi:hypothetical protein
MFGRKLDAGLGNAHLANSLLGLVALAQVPLQIDV